MRSDHSYPLWKSEKYSGIVELKLSKTVTEIALKIRSKARPKRQYATTSEDDQKDKYGDFLLNLVGI